MFYWYLAWHSQTTAVSKQPLDWWSFLWFQFQCQFHYQFRFIHLIACCLLLEIEILDLHIGSGCGHGRGQEGGHEWVNSTRSGGRERGRRTRKWADEQEHWQPGPMWRPVPVAAKVQRQCGYGHRRSGSMVQTTWKTMVVATVEGGGIRGMRARSEAIRKVSMAGGCVVGRG